MSGKYDWMYSNEELKRTTSKEDEINNKMIHNTSLETNFYSNPSVTYSNSQQVLISVKEEQANLKTQVNPAPVEKTNQNTHVESESNGKEVVSNENEEINVKVKKEDNTEDNVNKNRIERKRSSHFIKAGEKQDEESDCHFVDPETGERWIRCQNPFCRKWRFVPKNVEMPTISPWFCVLNTWDEEVASCAYPQLYDSVIITRKKEPQKDWLPTRECHFKRIELC